DRRRHRGAGRDRDVAAGACPHAAARSLDGRATRRAQMKCEDAALLLHAFADGELDPGRSRELESHIVACADCAARLRDIQAMQRAFARPELRETAPASLRARLDQALPAARPVPTRRAMLRGFALGGALSAVAATGVMVLLTRSDEHQRLLEGV